MENAPIEDYIERINIIHRLILENTEFDSRRISAEILQPIFNIFLASRGRFDDLNQYDMI